MQVTVSASDSADDKRLQAILVEIAGQHFTVNIFTQPMGSFHSIEDGKVSYPAARTRPAWRYPNGYCKPA